jgi:hypothetical protein
MIYSLEINHKKDLDIILFFHVKNAVHFSDDLWPKVLAASLKMKHSALILEHKIEFPVIDLKARWDQGENWLWLHPRALSTLLIANPTSFRDFKTLLKLSK